MMIPPRGREGRAHSPYALRTRQRHTLCAGEAGEEGGVFDGEVAILPFDQIGLAAPPIHMKEGANAPSHHWAARSVVVVLVSQPKIVVDSHLQAH